MSILLSLFITTILSALIVYIYRHSQRTLFTYGLIGIIVSQILWQGYIAVLYSVDILPIETAEFMFRLLRIGSLATPTFLFLTITETLTHSQEKISFMNKIFNRRNSYIYLAMTLILYGLNWTEWGVTHLTFVDSPLLPHYYPAYGPFGILQFLQVLTLPVWLVCAFYISKHMQNEYLKAFHNRFSMYAIAASIVGLFNFVEDYVIFNSLVSCALFTVGVLYSFNAFRDKVLESERRAEVERAKMEYVDYTTSSLVHEIKNPLTVLLGYMQLATAQENLDPSMKRKVDIMHNSTLHIQKVLDDFIGFIDTKEIQIEYACLNDLIEDSISMMSIHGADKGVSLTFSKCDDIYTGLDSVKLSQVFINLYKNAIDAISIDSPVKEVSTHIYRRANEVFIEIKDSGTGVPDNMKEELFQPFRTNKQGGMGLGLSICQSIVTSHKGTIRVKETSASGTVIEVKIPLEDYSDLFAV